MSKRRIESYKHRPMYLQLIRQIAITICWVFLAYEVFSSLIFSGMRVDTAAMSPLYQPGDFILVNRLPYGNVIPFTDIGFTHFIGPKYGDVVLLDPPYDGEQHIPVAGDIINFFTMNRSLMDAGSQTWQSGPIVRRIIALPGDRVYVSKGIAYVQIGGTGDFLEETILSDQEYELLLPDEQFMDPDLLSRQFSPSLRVPEKEYFVLADNRNGTFGSLDFGTIPIQNLRGKIVGRYFHRSENEAEHN